MPKVYNYVHITNLLNLRQIGKVTLTEWVIEISILLIVPAIVNCIEELDDERKKHIPTLDITDITDRTDRQTKRKTLHARDIVVSPNF